MNAKTFANWIKDTRNLKNITKAVKESAELLGVCENAYWKWYTEKTQIPAPMVKLMELIIQNENKGN